MPHLTGCACGGPLLIGDIICKECQDGPYQKWCDENGIPEEDR